MSIKQRIANWLLPKLLCSVDPYKVLKYDEKRKLLYLNGELLQEPMIKQFKQDAFMLKQTALWTIFQNTIRQQANEVMFTKSTDFNDMITGKAMLYNLDVLDKIIKIIEQI